MTIRRALISVSNKKNIVEFASELENLGVEIISTGGTAQLLKDNNINVITLEEYTKFPEILDGRVKTLHPKIHAGLLAKRDSKIHMDKMKELNIDTIDLVCVNLYPFAETIEKRDSSLDDAIENIDIGGPAMIRSSAKNWENVIVIIDNNDYSKIIEELKNTKGVSLKTRFDLAKKAFSHTAYYDGMISNYLTSIDNFDNKGDIVFNLFPQKFNQQWTRIEELRYGENPHQQAAFYVDDGTKDSIADAIQFQGKELSYNNIADLDAAWECVNSFKEKACVIVKHTNPSGLAVRNNVLDAYKAAFSADKTSAFGGIIAFNSKVDVDTMEYIINNQFMEVLIAPLFTAEALKTALKKPNIRVLQMSKQYIPNTIDIKRVNGGILVQTADIEEVSKKNFKVVSKRQPTKEEWEDLLFLWKVAKFVKSNAIILGKNEMVYGIGAGQMSRLDSTIIATRKAKEAGFDLNGTCAASDAFFPFKDGVETIAKSGIKAIIHPGGSIRDKEIFASADELNIAMVITSIRHFRH